MSEFVRWMFHRSRRPEVIRMQQCPRCAANPHEECISGGRRAWRNHSERLELARFVADISGHRDYFDALHTPYGALVSSPACEHCDGEKSAWVRHDTETNRGWVCPLCDHSLDAMYPEGKETAS